MTFKVEVPIEVKGTGGKSIREKAADDFSKQVKRLVEGIKGGAGPGKEGFTGTLGKGIGKAVGYLSLIAIVVEGLSFMLKPIMSLLKVILMLLFMPLIPLLKPVIKGLAGVAKWIAPIMRKIAVGVERIVKAIGEGATWIWENLLKPIWDGLVKAFEIFRDIGKRIWEEIIRPGFDFLSDVGKWIWEEIIRPGFSFLLNAGIWIWEQIIKPGFDFWKDIGEKLWNFIKGLFVGTISVGEKVWEMFKGFFRGTINVATTVWNWFRGLFGGKRRSYSVTRGGSAGDFISRPGQPLQKFSPQDTIIGVKDPSKIIGGGSITININNPVVRQERDIKSLANEISKILQRKMSGRIASG